MRFELNQLCFDADRGAEFIRVAKLTAAESYDENVLKVSN